MSRLTLYRSLVAAVFAAALAVASTVAAQRTASAMADAGQRFLASLTPDQRAQASMPFDSGERERFGFVPTEMFPRKGLRIKEMSPAQREAAHGLLRASLSQSGYERTSNIMQLEATLAAIETNGRLVRDPEIYYFSVFGTPAADGSWAWSVEGHHVSLNFTIVDGSQVAVTPSFLGTNPAEVRTGPRRGLRLLGDREDAARTLLTSLDARQRASAVIQDVAPRDILTSNETDIGRLDDVGVKGADLTMDQRDQLIRVIEMYTGVMTDEVAAERMNRMREAGIENVAFAWAGPAERGARHYYRVQGPTFLIEFDNTQNDGNHVHSIWRDFNGDFGRDLLREHLQAYAH